MRTTINSFQDLEAFGIKPLTGEACSFNLRILCDVTDRGARLMEAYWGGNITITRGKNWNNGRPEDPHVGTIMLTRGCLRELAEFILLYTRFPGEMVVLEDCGEGGSWPAKYDQEHITRIREMAKRDGISFWDYIKTVYRVTGYLAKPEQDPDQGRNVHQFSGRVQ